MPAIPAARITARSTMLGAEFPVSTTLSVCQPAGDHGPGAGHRLPRDCHPPDQKSGLDEKVGLNGSRHIIQRFVTALNLNIHFHMLFLDGVYVDARHGTARFRWFKTPTSVELT